MSTFNPNPSDLGIPLRPYGPSSPCPTSTSSVIESNNVVRSANAAATVTSSIRRIPENEWSNAEAPETVRPLEMISFYWSQKCANPSLRTYCAPQPQGHTHPPYLLLRPTHHHRSYPIQAAHSRHHRARRHNMPCTALSTLRQVPYLTTRELDPDWRSPISTSTVPSSSAPLSNGDVDFATDVGEGGHGRGLCRCTGGT